MLYCAPLCAIHLADGTLPGVRPRGSGQGRSWLSEALPGEKTGPGQPFELFVKAEARHKSVAPGQKVVASGVLIMNAGESPRQAKLVCDVQCATEVLTCALDLRSRSLHP